MSSDSDRSADISIDEERPERQQEFSESRYTLPVESAPAPVHRLPGQAPPPSAPPRRIVRERSNLSPYQSSVYLRNEMSTPRESENRTPEEFESVTERSVIFERLRERYGANLSIEDLENTPHAAQNMVPTRAEVMEIENHLFAKTRATTADMRMRVFAFVIDFFIKNGTSDQVDLSRTQVFPTGVRETIRNVWRVPAGHTLRSTLRYREAQEMAQLLSSREDNYAILRARADERGLEVNRSDLLFDFVHLPTLGITGQQARDINRFRRANLRGSRDSEAARARSQEAVEEPLPTYYETERA